MWFRLKLEKNRKLKDNKRVFKKLSINPLVCRCGRKPLTFHNKWAESLNCGCSVKAKTDKASQWLFYDFKTTQLHSFIHPLYEYDRFKAGCPLRSKRINVWCISVHSLFSAFWAPKTNGSACPTYIWFTWPFTADRWGKTSSGYKNKYN